jgi:uncharacterized protein YwqG
MFDLGRPDRRLSASYGVTTMRLPDAINVLLSSHDLVAHQASIVRSSKPSLRMTLTAPSEDAGATRIGGLPYLPANAAWPHGSNAEPLGFLAQINLNNLSMNPIGLPNTGILSFFYDTDNQPWGFYEDAGGWRVLYSSFDSPFRLTDYPSASKQPLLSPHGVQLIEETTIPAPRSIELDGISIEEGSDKWKSYYAMRDKLVANFEGGVAHRLFGHPDAIQGCMQRIIQFESRGEKLPQGVYSYYEHPRADELIPGSSNWKLVLQLDSDERLDVMWGDNGRLFFWMHEESIRNRQWNEAWVKLQCY